MALLTCFLGATTFARDRCMDTRPLRFCSGWVASFLCSDPEFDRSFLLLPFHFFSLSFPTPDATAWTQECYVLWWTTFLPVLHGHTCTACPHPSTSLLFLCLALVGRWVGQGTPSVCWETQATRPSISHCRPNPPGETWDDPTAPPPLRSSSTPTPTAPILLASWWGARNVYRRGPDGGLGSPRFVLGSRPR